MRIAHTDAESTSEPELLPVLRRATRPSAARFSSGTSTSTPAPRAKAKSWSGCDACTPASHRSQRAAFSSSDTTGVGVVLLRRPNSRGRVSARLTVKAPDSGRCVCCIVSSLCVRCSLIRCLRCSLAARSPVSDPPPRPRSTYPGCSAGTAGVRRVRLVSGRKSRQHGGLGGFVIMFN